MIEISKMFIFQTCVVNATDSPFIFDCLLLGSVITTKFQFHHCFISLGYVDTEWAENSKFTSLFYFQIVWKSELYLNYSFIFEEFVMNVNENCSHFCTNEVKRWSCKWRIKHLKNINLWIRVIPLRLKGVFWFSSLLYHCVYQLSTKWWLKNCMKVWYLWWS